MGLELCDKRFSIVREELNRIYLLPDKFGFFCLFVMDLTFVYFGMIIATQIIHNNRKNTRMNLINSVC